MMAILEKSLNESFEEIIFLCEKQVMEILVFAKKARKVFNVDHAGVYFYH